MNKYLENIVARTLRSEPLVEPRLASVFEPTKATEEVSVAFSDGNEPLPMEGTRAFTQSSIQTAGNDATGDRKQARRSAYVVTTARQWSSSDRAEEFFRSTIRAREVPDGTENFVSSRARSGAGETMKSESDGKAEASREVSPRAASDPRAGNIVVKTDTLGFYPAARTREPAIGNLPSAAIAVNPRAVEEREPAIRVTIGRIDVRAIMPAQPLPRPPRSERSAFVTLDEYLKRRDGGGR